MMQLLITVYLKLFHGNHKLENRFILCLLCNFFMKHKFYEKKGRSIG